MLQEGSARAAVSGIVSEELKAPRATRGVQLACYSLASLHRSARLRSDDSHSGHIDMSANHVCDQVFLVSTPFACGNQRFGNRPCVDRCWPKPRQTHYSEAFI